MNLNSNIYPTKEIILETINQNPNLKILNESEDSILFSDAAINFLKGEEVIHRANIDVDLDELLVGTDEELNFVAGDFLETLPEILFFGVEKINIVSDVEKTSYIYDFTVDGGCIDIIVPQPESTEANYLKNESDRDILEIDSEFRKKFFETIVQSLFTCLSENPIFFGEINENEVNFSKYIN